MRKISLFLSLGLILLGLASACWPSQSLVGQWRGGPPASLLFEYQADGTVMLVQDGKKYVAWYYQLVDKDTLQLYDGLGRRREYDFRLAGDTLTLYDAQNPGVVAETYTRAGNP